MDKMNLEKWDAKRLEIETTIRESKDRRTESHQPRWVCGLDEGKLADLKAEATGLYALRAALRGKEHFHEPQDAETVAALIQWGKDSGYVITVADPVPAPELLVAAQ